MLGANDAVVGEQAGAVEHVAQFADVAGPVVLLQQGHGLGLHRDPVPGAAGALQERIDQHRNVGHAVAQRGKVDGKGADAGATVQWILETPVRADHLLAAPYLKQRLGGQTGIGRHITMVQQVFGHLFNVGSEFARDGRQFDHLFAEGEQFSIGWLQARAMHTPGHTPACMTYVVSDGEGLDKPMAAFVGDTLFMPDGGTARCDFPGGDARTLYRSIHRVLSLPPETLLYMCHDYQPDGRELRFVSSVADERAGNIHVRNGISEDAFVAMRHARDATLDMPTLILPAVQVNMRAGQLPEPEDNGTRYIKIPLNAL